MMKDERELAEDAKKHFLYGYHFCRMNGFLFDEQLQSAAEEYARRVIESKGPDHDIHI